MSAGLFAILLTKIHFEDFVPRHHTFGTWLFLAAGIALMAGSFVVASWRWQRVLSIFGTHVPVRARVRSIGSYSAHADQNGLMEYITQANQGNSLKKCFVVQGEEEAAQALADRARNELGIDAIVPHLGQSFEL